MTERCNDDVAFLWWKYDYDEDYYYDYHGDGDNSYWDRDHKDDEKEKIFQLYFQQNCEMVVVASFSGSVRLILILPALWYYSA